MNTPITSETQLSHLLDYAEELAQSKADYRGQPADFQFLPDGTMTGKPNQGDLFAASMAPVTIPLSIKPVILAMLDELEEINEESSDSL